MPKANAKKKPAPVQPVVPTPPPVPDPVPPIPPPPELKVLYHQLEYDEYSSASAKGPLDPEWCKEALGWETEKEYKQRKIKQFPNTKPDAWIFGEVYHCKNLAGEKVRTNHNANNRAFDEDWCAALVYTILHGQWAGPFTIPGETVNGETIRISKYGRVISGQHQMSACILAGEWLAKARHDKTDHADSPKYPTWRAHGEPFIESFVIKGLSEDPRVLMTVDYVKPRTAADVFYTSEVFKSCTAPERKELCRMLAAAVDLLWTRTDARGYRTHPEIVGFLERHKQLLKCVTHLFTENSAKGGRKISKLRLSAGHCAALMYIMGSSGPETEGDFYRNEEPPTEKNLDWGLWDKAEEFWALLASGRDFVPVRTALAQLIESAPNKEENQGMGGRGPEKLAILAKAWERWKDHTHSGPPFDGADLEPGGQLHLSYSDLDNKGNKLPDGQIKLLDEADFYGIDSPDGTSKEASKGPPEPPPPTREEIDRLAQEAIARRQQPAKK